MELKGERFSGLNLITNKPSGDEKETRIFDGIDTTISGIARLTGNNQEQPEKNLGKLQEKIGQINQNSPTTSKLSTLLIEAYKLADTAKWSTRNPQTKFFIEANENEIRKAIRLAAGLQIDALASRETVAPDETFQTNVKIYFPENSNIKIKEIKLNAPNGWQISKTEPPKEPDQSFFRRETPDESAFFNVKIPKETELSQPYWLEKQRTGDLFEWKTDENQNLPFQKPLLTAKIIAEIDGVEITFDQPVEYRFADDIRGEIRRELNVVPKVSVEFEQNLTLVSDMSKSNVRELNLKIINNSENSIKRNGEVGFAERLVCHFNSDGF